MSSSAETTPLRLDCARWLLPVSSAAIEDGCLVSRDGEVVALGRRKDMLKEFSGEVHDHQVHDHQVRDHNDAAILPGLVNCHAHLELSLLRGKVASSTFCGWLAALIDAKQALGIEGLREGVRVGLAEARGFGTAYVADTISPHVIVPGLYPAGQVLGLVEVLGFSRLVAGERWRQAEGGLARLLAGRIPAALAPHSPYTVSEMLLTRCAAWPGTLSVHVAESVEEVEFLRSCNAAIQDLLASRGAWDHTYRPPGLSPVAYLSRLAMLRPGSLAVHCVQATGNDIGLLAQWGGAACLCPRSNAALGVGRAPLRELIDAGVKVCLGTDSLASVADLNLFREAEAAMELGATPEEALRLATLAGAEALTRPELGALSPGKRPQPIVLPLTGNEPVEAALEAGAAGQARFVFEVSV